MSAGSLMPSAAGRPPTGLDIFVVTCPIEFSLCEVPTLADDSAPHSRQQARKRRLWQLNPFPNAVSRLLLDQVRAGVKHREELHVSPAAHKLAVDQANAKPWR